jgi:TRAP-type mannitol/chloroaromatic compound transport system substrate-binding protein
MLWDDLASQHGFKPLAAGHSGPGGGLWASRRLETTADVSGARIHVEGLAAEVVRALGAVPVRLAAGDLRGGLAEGRIDAAELPVPLVLAAPDLQPLAERLYSPGFNAGIRRSGGRKMRCNSGRCRRITRMRRTLTRQARR